MLEYDTLAPSTMPLALASNVCVRPFGELEYKDLTEAVVVPRVEWTFGDDMPPTYAYRPMGSLVYKQPMLSIPVIHWGQLKLLLSEVEFLTWCRGRFGRDCLKDAIVVYIGAADGEHIPQLSKLFDDLVIHLYDPARFGDEVKRYSSEHPDRMRVFNQFFTDADCAQYAGRPTFLITDLRRVPKKLKKARDDPKDEDHIKELKDEDHMMQADWVRMIKPIATSLKFSPPYPPLGTKERPIFRYFQGHVRTQAFPPVRSTETRLIFEGVPQLVDYDCRAFEEVANYHNLIVRSRFLTQAQFIGGTLMIGDSPTVLTTSKQLTPELVRNRQGSVWQFFGARPHYDDWRMLNILRAYLLVRDWHGQPVKGPFDVLPAELAADDKALAHSTMRALWLMATIQETFGTTQLSKVAKKLRSAE